MLGQALPLVFIGSTNSRGRSVQVVYKGFNPTYDTEKVIQERISSWSMPKGSKNDVHSVIYGTGCLRLDRAQSI